MIALRNGVFDRAVERHLERLHGVRVVCAEGHLFGTVPGKATGMAARILHISTSEAEKASIALSIHQRQRKHKSECEQMYEKRFRADGCKTVQKLIQ